MLKAFLDSRHAEETAFWEGYFSLQSFEYLVRSFRYDPIRPLFERYCRDALVLEGGCGLGNYVTCLEALGARVVGLDFSTRMLSEFKRLRPGSRLIAGDVCALPFGGQTFDVYYSGGVMEHFESGPDAGLAEAHRVLRPGGVFLCSVPYENPIRRALGRRGADRHGMVLHAIAHEGATPPPPGHSFFQYFYRAEEFRNALRKHGFDILTEQPYSLWRGLTDIGVLGWLDRLYARRATARATPSPPGGAPAPVAIAAAPTVGRRSSAKDFAKWLIFAEDRTVPVLGRAVGTLCELGANMRMYVCRSR